MLRAKTKIVLATALAVAAVPVVWQEHAIARTRQENRALATAFEQLKPEAAAVPAQADWEARKARKAQEDRADLWRGTLELCRGIGEQGLQVELAGERIDIAGGVEN